MTSETGVTADDVDEILVALSHHQRRETLDILREAGCPLAVADLSVELARKLEDFHSEHEAKKRAEQLQVELYHCHVPRLAEAGLLEYNEDRRVVTLTETASESTVVDTERELAAFAR